MKFIMMGKFSGLVKNILKKSDSEAYPWNFLKELEDSLNIIEDLDLIGSNFLGKIRDIVPVKKLFLVLYDQDLGRFRTHNNIGFKDEDLSKVAFYRNDRLVKWLKVNKTYFYLQKQNGVFRYLTQGEQQTLDSLEIKLCYPLISMNRLIGIIFIGEKEDEQEFTKRELYLISSFTPQTAIALENALLYKEQRERFKKMLWADKLATIGELAAGAAHEIRNPLTAIKSSLQYLGERNVQSKNHNQVEEKLLNSALQETERIDRILSALLSFARPLDIHKESCDLMKIINESLELISFQARKQNVDVLREFHSPRIYIKCDKAQLKQLFLNLFLNSFQAMEEGGKLRVEVDKGSDSRGVVVISDTGKGIPDEDQDKIFDPFFTTKKGGTGLGLSICYGIIKSHNGDIVIKSQWNKGTTAIVKLPLEG
jgi:signal transduction histidine kinase